MQSRLFSSNSLYSGRNICANGTGGCRGCVPACAATMLIGRLIQGPHGDSSGGRCGQEQAGGCKGLAKGSNGFGRRIRIPGYGLLVASSLSKIVLRLQLRLETYSRPISVTSHAASARRLHQYTARMSSRLHILRMVTTVCMPCRSPINRDLACCWFAFHRLITSSSFLKSSLALPVPFPR